MNNLTEIKIELDKFYKEYRNNKNTLNKSKETIVAKLIIDINSSKDACYHDVAIELARFSAGVTGLFFDILTKSENIQVIDDILKELLATDTDAKLSQYYVSKYASAIISIMKNCKENALKSSLLPELVCFIARFAVKSDKNKNKFYNLINNTMGGIFKLDYSGFKKNSLQGVWNATNIIYPDLSKAKYESFIMEWSKKYGFTETVKTEDKKVTPKENTNNNTLKRSSEHEAIVAVVTELISPISKAVDSIQGEISKSREIGIENVTLKTKIKNLECQLAEQNVRLQDINQSLMSAKSENDNLKNQITALESKNSELDSKLNDAYAINSREFSLGAAKIRSELKKTFTFLYEYWLEYENSDVSEENYESLQVIIKKIFRSLERNGIDFKENN